MRRSLQKRRKDVLNATKKGRAKVVQKAAKKVRSQLVQKAPSLQAPSQSENDTERQMSFEDRYEVDPDIMLVRRSELVLNQGRRRDGEIVIVANHQKGLLSAHGNGVPGGAIHEVGLLKGMQHPNVVQLLDVFCDTSKTVVVLGHAGSSLAEYLKDGQSSFNESQTRAMCLQLLLGIECCHSHGIHLSNLKPQNIFVDMSTSTPALRVAGFSSARLIPQEYRCGGPMTITYLAPEILLGSMESLCMEADMWSAGCVLGELVTGFPIFFAGHTEIGTLFRIFEQCGTPRETTWPGVTELPDFSHHFPQWTGQAWGDSFRDKLGFGGTALLSDLLTLDPRSRPSARRALQHPWFTCLGPCTSAEIDKFRLRFGSCWKACCRRPLGHLLQGDVLSLVESFVGQSHAPQLAEYATDISQLAREREEWSCPRADFWNTAMATVTQNTVQEHGLKCRAILCDWMIEVCRKFEIPDSTMYLSVAIVDRYISKRQIERQRFQCLGVAAMVIANKFLDENMVERHRWVYISERAFTLEDLAEMEVRILEVIQFKLTAPTVPFFLRRFLSVNDSSESHGHLAHFLAELTLLRVTDFPWPPSHIAAAAIALSNILLKRTEHWPPAMEVRTGYALRGSSSPEIPSRGCSGGRTPLDECVGKLRALLGHVGSGTLQASAKKYAGKFQPIAKLARQAACDGHAD